VTEPQVWVLIGVFAASMGVLITLVLRVVRADLATMRAEFARVGDKVDRLDRDVQAMITRPMDR
jgi:hypothetical protein